MAEKLIIAGSAKDAAKAKTGSNVYLAGGTEVMRLGSSVNGKAFVSVRKARDMHKISATKTKFTFGAACTFQELLGCDKTPDYLKEALLFMASRTRRNMATVGGNIVLRRDDSFLIPTLIAAGAEIHLMDKKGEETKVAICDYVFDAKKYKDYLITKIAVPADGAAVKSVRNTNTAQSHARLTVALSLKNGKYKAVAAVKNSGLYVLDDLAAVMNKEAKLSEDDIVEFIKGKKEIKLKDDLLYGGADYRRYLIGISFALMYKELNGKGGCA